MNATVRIFCVALAWSFQAVPSPALAYTPIVKQACAIEQKDTSDTKPAIFGTPRPENLKKDRRVVVVVCGNWKVDSLIIATNPEGTRWTKDQYDRNHEQFLPNESTAFVVLDFGLFNDRRCGRTVRMMVRRGAVKAEVRRDFNYCESNMLILIDVPSEYDVSRQALPASIANDRDEDEEQ